MLLQIFSPVKTHFLICFLALVIYRYLERDLENAFSCETILDPDRGCDLARLPTPSGSVDNPHMKGYTFIIRK